MEPKLRTTRSWSRGGVVGVRAVIVAVALTVAAAAGYGAWVVASPIGGQLPLAAIPATATLTGTVEAPVPFTAARVFIRNVDRRVLYMVYTHQGRFRAVALFPGNYEIHVETNGLESAVQTLAINAGDAPNLNFSLRETNPTIRRIVSGGADLLDASDPVVQRQVGSYDEVNPPGPGRDIFERSCMLCHGENFFAARPASRATWTSRVDYMQGKALFDRSPTRYAEGLATFRNQSMRFGLEDRQVLLDYLVTHFGPDAEPRFVPVEQEMPLDEEILGKAMYMEYYLTEDPPGELGNAPEFNSRRRGQDPRFDAHGNVWLTDRNWPNRLVKLDPRTGEQTDYLLPDPLNGNHELIVDRQGMIWLPEHSGRQPTAEKRLLGFNPETEAWEYLIPMDPDGVLRNEIKWLHSLALDSKDNIYVSWIHGGALSKYERATGKVTVFPLPNINAIPYGVVADSRDNIFTADWGTGGIAKFDTETEQFTLFSPPSYPGQVRRLNVDRHDNVWWGVYGSVKRPGFLARLDQTTGKITEYVIPRGTSQPYDVMEGPDGTLWVPDFGGQFAAILNFDPRTEEFRIYPTPQNADMPKVQVTRDGAVWYSPRGSNDYPGFGVLYPDMDRMTTLGAYYLNGPPGYPFTLAADR